MNCPIRTNEKKHFQIVFRRTGFLISARFERIDIMEESATATGIAPHGLQDVLNRLAHVALSNKPVCFYECFADALERDVIRRTLLEIQAEQCKFDEC